MTIGNKQKRVTIETPNLISDGQGGHKPGIPPYVPRAVVWAHERPLSGAEAIRAEQLTAVLASVWEIWFREDISVKDRIRFKSRIAEIQSFIDPDDSRDELYLFCSEVQA
jgi:SPP1 family predicted phage head-tail adaptor